MKVKIGISARHLHLTKEDYDLLFDEEMNIERPINQPGQYASDKTVTLINGDKKLENIRIIGPLRPYTQVELSKTDAYKLGLTPPIRKSGDLREASSLTIKTQKGEITRNCAIITNRHIHLTPEDREKYGLTKDIYSVKVSGEKGGILDNVHLSESPKSYFEMHIDTDDANAFLLNNNDEVEIIN